ncbi:MAG: hypothetical protein ABI844_13395 [Saprospiraceae bacterium]
MKTKIFKLVFLMTVILFTTWLMWKGASSSNNSTPEIEASVGKPTTSNSISTNTTKIQSIR